jgi:steroid 5-alpha reductase family enzyme
MVHSKLSSMLILTAIYLFATFVGIIVFRMFSDWQLIIRVLVADIAATLVIYCFSLILDNASLYDPYWSVQPPVVLFLVFMHLEIALTLPIFIMLCAITIWAVRLTMNWAVGFEGFHEQDWRYTMLKQKAPKLYPITNLFGIQMMPTILVFAQLYGAILFMQKSPRLHFLVIIGAIMMVAATIIQYIADDQMKKFRKQHQGQKSCIDRGLWSVSRHPNYFGEIMVWWGLYVIYLSQSMQIDWIIIAPLFMTLLFLFISIPMMETKILLTRPEYKAYQEQVSVLIPWFRKTNDQETSAEYT